MQAFESNAGRQLQRQTGNVDRQFQAQQANEEARRLGQSLGLNASVAMGGLDQSRQDMQLRGAEALSGVGARQQQREQAGLDMAYQDFINQRDYPQNQLNAYAGLINGVPYSPSSTTTATGPTPDFLSQLIGMGTAGAGVWDYFN